MYLYVHRPCGHLWSKTLSAPSFGHYWKQPIWSAYLRYSFFLQVANLVFFALFLRNIFFGVWANAKSDPVVAQQNQRKLHAVIKMFFVMGITWIAEIISFILFWIEGAHKVYKTVFIFQLINSLQVSYRRSRRSQYYRSTLLHNHVVKLFLPPFPL